MRLDDIPTLPALDFPAPPPALPVDRVAAALRRRLEGCRERRRAHALSPGNDEHFRDWTREVERGRKLSTALIRHLSRRLP